jgi:alpha-glucosidase
VGDAPAAIRAAAGDALLIGEVYLPAVRWAPYLEHLDAAFAFELLHAPWEAGPLRAAIEASTRTPGAAWVMSNHDFGRLGTRFGEENARAAALLLLTLPGPAFLYQGDEIGQLDGPAGEARHDRAGRDRYRHPMQWDGTPGGGFSTGTPWLPPVDPGRRNVEAQRGDARSTLSFVRELIALRRELGEGFELLVCDPGVIAFRRGLHVVAINVTGAPRPAPPELGEVVLATHERALERGQLAASAGVLALD